MAFRFGWFGEAVGGHCVVILLSFFEIWFLRNNDVNIIQNHICSNIPEMSILEFQRINDAETRFRDVICEAQVVQFSWDMSVKF